MTLHTTIYATSNVVNSLNLLHVACLTHVDSMGVLRVPTYALCMYSVHLTGLADIG
jgi:hypothetical protein